MVGRGGQSPRRRPENRQREQSKTDDEGAAETGHLRTRALPAIQAGGGGHYTKRVPDKIYSDRVIRAAPALSDPRAP